MSAPRFWHLLLWISACTGSRALGQVSSPPEVTGFAGEPLALQCNISLGAEDEVQQVRWLDASGQLLLAYRPGTPVRVSHRSPDVQLTASRADGSALTLGSVRLAHQGCYRCVFDVFPSGSQEGRTCVSVTGKLSALRSVTAVEGEPGLLSCRYSLPEQVVQVLWRKAPKLGSASNVASYSNERYKVEPAFAERFALSRSLALSQLSVRALRREDESCYTCEFHTFPDGTKHGSVCLAVYVLPRPEVTLRTTSPGVTEVNCTARSRPEATISWDVRGRNQSSARLSSDEADDGTKVVTSTLILETDLLSEAFCVVQHPGLREELSVPVLPPEAPNLAVPLAVSAALVLLVGVCFCVCKFCICSNDELQR